MSQLPQIDLKVSPGITVSLELLLRNQGTETLVLHPKLENWVIDGEQIITPVSSVDPVCILLSEKAEQTQIMKLSIPSDLQPGQILTNWLRFPGTQEEGIFMRIEISKLDQQQPSIINLVLPINLPFFSPNHQRDGISGLILGLMELDYIPTRWMVAEILVKLCQFGEEYSQSQSGRDLIQQLSKTSFFQIGVIALEQTQLVNWITNTLRNIKLSIPINNSQQSLLDAWTFWWFSLNELDLEIDAESHLIAPSLLLAENFINHIGKRGEKWFANLLLGLVQLSPTIALNLKKIATQPPKDSQILTELSTQSSYNLATGLSGFDLLPVRWLVLEILLLLNDVGREYMTTETGEKLLNQLSGTRLFKNLVIAFISAQLPRWIAISQGAANAYYESLGIAHQHRGILYYWENWLWSLTGIELNSAGIKHITSSKNIFTVLKQEQINVEELVGSMIMGLVKISPRIAAQVQQIAAKSPHLSRSINQIPIKVNHPIDDIINQSGNGGLTR